MRPTIARSRTSAPAFSARGIQATRALCLALVEQPKLQKPRYTQGGDAPRGAEAVASGVGAQAMPSFSAPRASTRPAALTSCGRYG